MSTLEFLNYIDGEFVAADGKTMFPKINPFTGEVLGQVMASEAMDVIRAIQGAKKAEVEFQKWTYEQRAELLEKIAVKIEERANDIAAQEALHQGLLQSFVLDKSVRPSILAYRQAAALTRAFAANRHPQLLLHPTGLISFILSWNLSWRLLSERLSASIAAGNISLVKVSEFSPVTAKLLGEILSEVQAPRGLVQLLQGRGADVGALLAAHPAIRGVHFVGQLRTAEKVLQGATAQFKKVQIHAGVKNNIFVLNEVDFTQKMPEILQSFLLGQGQLCWNTTRVFILESLQKEFTEVLKSYLAGLKPAASPQDESPWTPLISEEALQKVEAKVAQIKVEEGKILAGGGRGEGPGFFFQPTVSLDLPNCSEMQQDEIRGPVLILTAVKYQHEMLKWANTSYYAHSAVIWAPNAEKALKVAEKVEAANVSVNSWLPDQLEPGFRQSSFGNLQTGPWGRFYSDVKILTGL